MRILTIALLALCIQTASAQTGLPAPCGSDFAVHAYVEGQASNDALVDGDDIQGVSRRAEDGSRLMISLENPAAERMKAFTSSNIGEELVVVCQGDTVWKARIASTFGGRFEIRLDEGND
ncbi:MAG: hypothetical protein GVY32_06485 [Gammaproteobacteria bacterium]|jgi:preprotein translocase subunit SecD|nr:hypothetical protein [Gammaproteobacteria bacterium]NBD95409.1 hypothetical protein [Gammaproteobacteria bacterium]